MGGTCDRISGRMRQVLPGNGFRAGRILQARLSREWTTVRGRQTEATYKHYKYYGDFIYQEPFPVGEDKTKYRLLTKVREGRGVRRTQDPQGRSQGLELLSKELMPTCRSTAPRISRKLRNILEDPEATDNDKFVAYTMLLNQTVSAEGELPTCQDTGTAICIGHRARGCLDGGRRRRVHRPGRLQKT